MMRAKRRCGANWDGTVRARAVLDGKLASSPVVRVCGLPAMQHVLDAPIGYKPYERRTDIQRLRQPGRPRSNENRDQVSEWGQLSLPVLPHSLLQYRI